MKSLYDLLTAMLFFHLAIRGKILAVPGLVMLMATMTGCDSRRDFYDDMLNNGIPIHMDLPMEIGGPANYERAQELCVEFDNLLFEKRLGIVNCMGSGFSAGPTFYMHVTDVEQATDMIKTKLSALNILDDVIIWNSDLHMRMYDAEFREGEAIIWNQRFRFFQIEFRDDNTSEDSKYLTFRQVGKVLEDAEAGRAFSHNLETGESNQRWKILIYIDDIEGALEPLKTKLKKPGSAHAIIRDSETGKVLWSPENVE